MHPVPVITADQRARVAAVRHLTDNAYRDLDLARTLEFYARRYVAQAERFRQIDANTRILDIGAGYGWLAMAFALSTPARVTALELDAERLAAGREIAGILGVADRIDWRSEPLGSISLADRSADIVYCVEVLEHVDGDVGAVRDLARLSTDLVIITTPNGWFPAVAHDTRLPFAHWLPKSMRHAYARALGRDRGEIDNHFWSPLAMDRAFDGFDVVSGFLHYRSLGDYLATYPLYLPYLGSAREQAGPGAVKLAYYRAASLLGSRSRYVLPNLAAVYRRRTGP
jgi:2-polyprenyl-3-methyl-5-hydroxy-6-metoxy-1,4-benzoquinol methylase